MTRLAVAGVGYTEASTLLHDAHLWGARHHAQLRDGLAGTGAMAGDSSFADAFATSYDAAARVATAALADLVTSCAQLARIALVSLENHTRAELASTVGADPEVVTEAPSMLSGGWVEVTPFDVPSSLGGDLSSLPGWANAILDHVEGFLWPDADLDRLAQAATAWRAAAAQLEELAVHVDRAAHWLDEERSPEIPIAIAAITDLAAVTRDLAAECAGLGASCSDYAAAVQEQRAAILDLVHDLLRDAVLIQMAGFALGFATAGTTNYAAGALNLAKISAEAPRFHRMIQTLRFYAFQSSLTLNSRATALTSIQLRLERYVGARVALRGEAGTIQMGGRSKSFLELHEGGAVGGHTIRKHVGKSDDYLRARLRRERSRAMVSTFFDEATAEASLKAAIAAKSATVERWLGTPGGSRLPINRTFEQAIGRVMMRSGEVVPGHRLRAVLVKDSSMPDGYPNCQFLRFPLKETSRVPVGPRNA